MPALLVFFLASSQPDLAGEASKDVARQNCLPVDSEEILVCGRRRPGERYRLPDCDGPFDPAGGTPSVMRERISWADEGDTGTQSCGAVGRAAGPAAWFANGSESGNRRNGAKTCPGAGETED